MAVTVTGPTYGLPAPADWAPVSEMVATGARVSARAGTASTKSILSWVPPVGSSVSVPLVTVTRLVAVANSAALVGVTWLMIVVPLAVRL